MSEDIVVTWQDLVKAKQLKDLGPPEDVDYIERERHAIAVHEACHAVVGYRAKKNRVIDIATIEKGGSYLGMVASISPEDTFTRWKSEYEGDIMSALASLVGERMFFGEDNSSGVSGDLYSATRIAMQMESSWGMGRTIAVHDVMHAAGLGGGGKPSAKKDETPDPALADRVEKYLRELYERTERLLANNRLAVLSVAHALETYKTMTGEDIYAVIECRRGPIVDGRPYAEARDVLEAYHAACVTAHHDATESTIHLPVLEGQ